MAPIESKRMQDLRGVMNFVKLLQKTNAMLKIVREEKCNIGKDNDDNCDRYVCPKPSGQQRGRRLADQVYQQTCSSKGCRRRRQKQRTDKRSIDNDVNREIPEVEKSRGVPI